MRSAAKSSIIVITIITIISIGIIIIFYTMMAPVSGVVCLLMYMTVVLMHQELHPSG